MSASKPKRNRKPVYLIDYTTDAIKGFKLPSRIQVLRFLVHKVREGNGSMSVAEACNAAAKAVCELWERARIPTMHKCRIVRKAADLHKEWRVLQKSAKRKSKRQAMLENSFKDTFEDLFDIAHGEAMKIMSIQEDKDFLVLQRQKGRPGSMSSVRDMKLHGKESRRRERLQKEENRKRKLQGMLRPSLPSTSVVPSSESDTEDINLQHESTVKVEEPNPVTNEIKEPKIRKRRGRTNVFTSKLVGTIDTTKTSVRKSTAVVGATALPDEIMPRRKESDEKSQSTLNRRKIKAIKRKRALKKCCAHDHEEAPFEEEVSVAASSGFDVSTKDSGLEPLSSIEISTAELPSTSDSESKSNPRGSGHDGREKVCSSLSKADNYHSHHSSSTSSEAISSSSDDSCDDKNDVLQCYLAPEPHRVVPAVIPDAEQLEVEVNSSGSSSSSEGEGDEVEASSSGSTSSSEVEGDTDDSDSENSDYEHDDPHHPADPPDPNDPGDDQDNPQVPYDPQGPNDPQGPDDPYDPDGHNDLNNENLGNFHLDSVHLNGVCRTVMHCTKREALALILAIAVKNASTYEVVVDMMILLNTVLGRDYLPTNPLTLWKWLGRTDHGITKYAYCIKCRRDLGLFENLAQLVVCACGYQCSKSHTRFYITLSLSRQLQMFLNNPRTRNFLYQFRRNRAKINPNNVEDILDGEVYMRMRQPGGVLYDDNNFSYTFNTDGFQTAKKSKTSAWPIYIRLNELPMSVRQNYIFMAALWIDEKKPNMQLFMDRFIEEANALSQTGVTWQREDGVQVTCRFYPTVCVCDAMARCEVLNMVTPTGYFSCNFCSHSGAYLRGIKFPLVPPVPFPLPVLRTHEDFVDCMENAPQRGLKGFAAIVNMDHFDMGEGFSTDDLHPIFLGVTVFHLSLFMKNVGEDYYLDPAKKSMINARLRSIRTPTFISRKPRPIRKYSNYNGTECRNFLLYYLVPCLTGVLRENAQQYLDHFALLSQAVFLLSRETISQQDIQEAERCIERYVELFQEYFGEENMRYVIHILHHVIICFQRWGPPYAHTTFHFEAWNHHLMKKITSPKGAIEQVVFRFLMNSFVRFALDREDISEHIKAKINEMLNTSRKAFLQVGNVCLLGSCDTRPASEEEQELFQARGYNCRHIRRFRRALVDGIEYRSCHYLYDGEVTRSDNSYIYTWNDEFGVIDQILLVENGEDQVVFLTVNILQTLDPINPSLTYIVEIDVNHRHLLVLMTFNEIRTHAIRIDTPHLSCIMPVANRYEID